MLQPATAWIVCRQCNASYDSVAKLREHEKTADRRASSEDGTSRHGGVPERMPKT